MGRAHRRGASASISTRNPEKVNAVVGKDLKPGDMVSMDQCVCAVRGRLPFKRGRERESLRYVGGTIFVDHASGFVFVVHQVSFTATETIAAKRLFEQEMGRAQIKVKEYQTDNGVFKAASFLEAVENSGQKITFSGVGAQFQNGVAERSIKTVVEKARTL